MQPQSKRVVVGEADGAGMRRGVRDPSGIAGEFPCPLATGSRQRRGGRGGGRKPLEELFAQCGCMSSTPEVWEELCAGGWQQPRGFCSFDC